MLVILVFVMMNDDSDDGLRWTDLFGPRMIYRRKYFVGSWLLQLQVWFDVGDGMMLSWLYWLQV